MSSTWTTLLIFWFIVVFPCAAAYALHKVREWIDGPEPHLGCPDPDEQDRHNESQHARVIAAAVNLMPYKRGDIAVKK